MQLNEIFVFNFRKYHNILMQFGWRPTTVPNEYKHPRAPGYAIDLEIHKGEPFAVFQGDKRIAQVKIPPKVKDLMGLKDKHTTLKQRFGVGA